MIDPELEQVVDRLLKKGEVNNSKDITAAVNQCLQKDLSVEIVMDQVMKQLNEFRHVNVEVLGDGRLIYRDRLFAQTVFKVRLTAEEIRDKRMYIGHRLLPFVNPEISVKEIALIDEQGKQIPKGEAKISFMDGMKYITLIAPYQASDYFKIGKNDLVLPYFDLKDWMKEVDYQQEDLLEWMPIDVAKRQWRLEKLSLTEFNRSRIKINHKDVKLLDGIYDYLDNHSMAIPVDLMLFRVFAHGPEHLLEELGSPVGPLLTVQDDIELFNSDFPFIHYTDFHQQFLAEKMEEMEEQEIPEPGTSTHLDGIFIELQTFYTEIYVKALFLNRILQKKALTNKALIQELFSEEDVFQNPVQKKNFDQAANEIRTQMQKNWSDRRLELPKVSLLRKYLEMKRIIFVAIDKMMEVEFMIGETNFEQFFFVNSVNDQLDQTIEFLIDEFSEGELPMEEIRILSEQFDTMIQQFRDHSAALMDDFSED